MAHQSSDEIALIVLVIILAAMYHIASEATKSDARDAYFLTRPVKGAAALAVVREGVPGMTDLTSLGLRGRFYPRRSAE